MTIEPVLTYDEFILLQKNFPILIHSFHLACRLCLGLEAICAVLVLVSIYLQLRKYVK